MLIFPTNILFFTRRRLDSLHLDPPRHSDNHADNDYVFHVGRYSAQLPEDTVLQGEELYLHFFYDRLRSEGLRAEGDLDSFRRHTGDTASALENFQDPIWRQTGRALQILADQFARSHERLMVRQRAEQVDISSLTKDKFLSMLSELFKGGRVTRERILVLFFFCSDVAICAIRNEAGRLLASLTEWSLIFIKDQVG